MVEMVLGVVTVVVAAATIETEMVVIIIERIGMVVTVIEMTEMLEVAIITEMLQVVMMVVMVVMRDRRIIMHKFHRQLISMANPLVTIAFPMRVLMEVTMGMIMLMGCSLGDMKGDLNLIHRVMVHHRLLPTIVATMGHHLVVVMGAMVRGVPLVVHIVIAGAVGAAAEPRRRPQ